MMTSAIGKAATTATAIVEVNALANLHSGRCLPTYCLLHREEVKTPSPGRCREGVFARARRFRRWPQRRGGPVAISSNVSVQSMATSGSGCSGARMSGLSGQKWIVRSLPPGPP
jgi:hypothetical protein